MCSACWQAMAAHNAGGLVIVQVERIVERGSLPPRLVHLPGALVDKVYQNPKPTRPARCRPAWCTCPGRWLTRRARDQPGRKGRKP